MTKPTLDPSQLTVDERLALIDELWASIARDEPSVLETTPEQKAELERRSAELRANPELAVPWETAREEILKDLERGA